MAQPHRGFIMSDEQKRQPVNAREEEMDKNEAASSIDNGVGQFVAEASVSVYDETPLFDPDEYPVEQRKRF